MLRSFDRYILREVLSPFGIGLLLYSFVLLMNQILILTEQLITRGVSLLTTVKLLVTLIPAILAFTIPMAVLMGILAGLSRLSSDSEVVAFKTLGIGNDRLIRPLLVFALAGWAVTLFLTLYLAPRTNHLYVQTYFQSVLAKVKIRITPRVFSESIPNTVIYVQDVDRNDDWKDILMYSTESEEEPRIVLARRGRLALYPKQKRAAVELENGADHSYPRGVPESYKITYFSSLREEIPFERLFSTIPLEKSVREKDIAELLRDLKRMRSQRALPGEENGGTRELDVRVAEKREKTAIPVFNQQEYRVSLVEVHKKFALPFACFVFVFLGLPLGVTTRKGGRTSGFTLSIVIILIYYVLITAGEQMARDGRLSPFLGMWGGNLLFLAASVYFFLKSNRESPFLLSLNRKWRERKRRRPERPKRSVRKSVRPAPAFPNILDRYIIKKYGFIFVLVFVSLMAITVVVTFFERIHVLYEHQKPMSMLLEFLWYSLPEFMYFTLPVSALTAMLLALGLLTKSNEITAMKACGISLYRVVLPVLVLAAGVSLFSFLLQERVIPGASRRALQTWDAINDVPSRSYGYSTRNWMVNRNKDRFFHYLYFDPAQSVFRQISIIDLDPSTWSFTRHIFAEHARLVGSILSIEDGWIRRFSEDVPAQYEKIQYADIPIGENKDFFLKEGKAPTQMTIGELWSYIREVKELGFDTSRLRVDWNSKLAFPLVSLIMTLLGIPFAFAMGRRGALVGIGFSVLIAMVFWGTIGLSKGLGNAGFLSPWFAAWAPNLIFGLAGLYSLFTLRT